MTTNKKIGICCSILTFFATFIIAPVRATTAIVNFNDLPDSSINKALNGEYPTGVIDWGNNIWYLSGPLKKFKTNSVSFNISSNNSASFTFLSPAIITSIQAFNSGNKLSTVTLSCSTNPTVTKSVNPNALTTINTEWTNTCTIITLGSSNGWLTKFDNIVYEFSINPTPTLTPTPSILTPTPTPSPTPTPTPTLIPTPTPTTEPTPTPIPTLSPTPTITPTPTPLPGVILFSDGYEGGLVDGSFNNWSSTVVASPVGEAMVSDDTIIFYEGSHSGKFEVSDGIQGGFAYTNQEITWPTVNKLWYSCSFRIDDYLNAALGGIYLMQAYIRSGAWRDRADIEIVDANNAEGLEPGQILSPGTFLLRMAYRGRDGSREGHRQSEMIQAPTRNTWHNIQMLIDLSGTRPKYAWWLNDRFIWQDTDTSNGTDTQAPTDFQAGLTNIDWGQGNQGRVWMDSCTVSTFGPEPLAPTPTP